MGILEYKIMYFFISAIIFFISLRNYHKKKSENSTKIYFFIMVLLSVLSFAYFIYYYNINKSLINFLHLLTIIELCIYVLVFFMVFNFIFIILNSTKNKFPIGLYIIPLFMMVYIINDSGSLLTEYMRRVISPINIFKGYILFMVCVTIILIFTKIKIIEDKEQKSNFYIFSIIYIVFSFLFLYTYSNYNLLIYSIGFSDISILMAIIPVLFMYRLINNFNFSKSLPNDIVCKVIDSINESVIIADIENNIIYTNKNAEKLIPSNIKNVREILINADILSELEEKLSKEVYINSNEGTISSIVSFLNVRDRFDEVIGKIFIFQNLRQLLDARHRLERVQKKIRKEDRKKNKRT